MINDNFLNRKRKYKFMGKSISIFIFVILFFLFSFAGCSMVKIPVDKERPVIQKVLEKHDVIADWNQSLITTRHPYDADREYETRKSLATQNIDQKVVFWNLSDNSRLDDPLPMDRHANLLSDQKFDVVFIIYKTKNLEGHYGFGPGRSAFGEKLYYEVVHWPEGSSIGIQSVYGAPPQEVTRKMTDLSGEIGNAEPVLFDKIQSLPIVDT